MKHLLDIRSLDAAEIHDLLALAADFKLRSAENKPLPQLRKVVGLFFLEDSTRTRVSFEQAAYRLGMKTLNFGAKTSSMNKGETLKDTILVLRHEHLDALVMRHPMSGSSHLAARFFGGPVLNAGDGQHEHPTQALSDALTILERKGSIVGLQVAIVGDIEHSRVARSNAWLLTKLGAEVRFVGPRTLIPKHMGLIPGKVSYDLISGISEADVVMCLRLQRERMEDGLLSSIQQYSSMYQINQDTIRHAAADCLVMHPGPINRGVEIDDATADGERSAITSQIANGVFVRMAALYRAFEEEPAKEKVKVKAVAP